MSGRHRVGTVSRARQALIRALVVLTVLSGVHYLAWRWLESVNWAAWWLAVPLVLAETYSLVEACFSGMTVWRLRRRGEPPPVPQGLTVDVLVTTYDEPLDLVLRTARAAAAIRYPHRTWILDDGDRADFRAAAEREGIGYLTRRPEWEGRPRHAKAGNLNNALFATEGEFLAVLDADQIADPSFLDRTLGWFEDPQVALVQTPQWFCNVDRADVLGSRNAMFFGPVMQGKDGWNAAYFCGTNAVLRRDALMQIGLVDYVRSVEQAVRSGLAGADRVLARARREARDHGPAVATALDRVSVAVRDARAELASGLPASEVTYRFHRRVDEAGAAVVAADLLTLDADLAEIEALSPAGVVAVRTTPGDTRAVERLARADWSPLGALGSVKALTTAVDIGLDAEAQPVMPISTISVTEDMATTVRLHALGWRSVYQHEVLARGLAPEDLGAMLSQRLRWSQGALQVMLRENPLLQRGLSWGQKLQYASSIWSNLSGFATLMFLIAPVAYLMFGVAPVQTFGDDLMVRLLPFLAASQLLSAAVHRGNGMWRGQQYDVALFPVWIRAFVTAAANVWLGRSLGFVVTPKSRQERGTSALRLIRPQLVAMVVLVVAAVVGVVRMGLDLAPAQATWLNLIWVAYDLLALSILLRAARYRGPAAEKGTT